MECVVVFRKQCHVVWYNVADTRVWVHSCRYLSEISQQPDCFSLLRLLKNVRAVVSYLIRPTPFISLRIVSSGSSSAFII